MREDTRRHRNGKQIGSHAPRSMEDTVDEERRVLVGRRPYPTLGEQLRDEYGGVEDDPGYAQYVECHTYWASQAWGEYGAAARVIEHVQQSEEQFWAAAQDALELEFSLGWQRGSSGRHYR